MASVIKLKRSATAGSIPADLADGEIAYNTADELLFGKNAAGTIVALNQFETPEGTRKIFTATEGQTSFPVVYDTSVPVDLYVNGIKMGPSDFSATSGTAVELVVPASAGDIVQFLGGYIPQNLDFAASDHTHTEYEPTIAVKNTAFNKDFGIEAGTVAEGDHQHEYAEVGNSAGLVTGAKIYCYQATTDGSGNATIDISGAGYTSIINLLATAEGGDGTAENTPHASVVSHTNTSVTVKTLESAGGGGLLVSVTEGMQDSPNRLVYLTVIGS